MNLRASIRAAVMVMTLCSVALSYLWLHARNIQLAEREFDLQKRRRILADRVEALELEVAKLAGFARTESLWTAQGRRGAETGGLLLGRR